MGKDSLIKLAEKFGISSGTSPTPVREVTESENARSSSPPALESFHEIGSAATESPNEVVFSGTVPSTMSLQYPSFDAAAASYGQHGSTHFLREQAEYAASKV
jgi:hypothetical protein